MKKLIATVCTVFALYSQAQLNNGLVICMPMDNNANDFSGNANNGTLNGVVTSATGHTGALNTAYSFNNSYINVPTSASIDQIETNDEISVSIWCNVSGWHASSRNFPVIERYKSVGDDGWQLNLFDQATTSVDMGFGNGLAMLGVYDTIVGVVPGTWQHFVWVYSQAANTCKYYVNGFLVSNSTLSGSTALFNTSSGPIRIGFSQAGVDEKAVGLMDDLRVYNRVLTPAEVYALYADTNLTCASTTSTVTPPAENCCLGNKCGQASNPLTANYEIPLNNRFFNFSGDNLGKVNVGYNCSLAGIGRFNSKTTKATNQAGSGQESVSIYGHNLYNHRSETGIGVMGNARNSETGVSVGVWGNADGNGNNWGGRFFAGQGGDQMPNRYNVGVSGVAFPSTGNPPPYTYQAAYPNGANIGVYGAGELNNTPDKNIPPGQDWAGWFDGDVNIVGACFQNLNWQFSDKRLKKDIKGLENVTERIKKLSGYTYSFRTDEFKQRGFDNKSHIGLIAQEVKEVFPELITEDAKGFYAVDYQGMIPVLLQVAKEQQALVEKLQQQVAELKAVVTPPSTGNTEVKAGTATAQPVTLSDKNVVVLNQNVPNPFAESTVISYNVPADFTKAQIIFTTENGTVIKTVDIKEKGTGTLNVFANDLSHGIYSYSLIIDGKTVGTKKMIKE
jgi:hypothetical protein